jgi:hypothetical protein
MTRRPDPSPRAVRSVPDKTSGMQRCRSDSLPTAPVKMLRVVRRHQSAKNLLAPAPDMPGRRLSPKTKSFYAHVVQNQLRRRSSEIFARASTTAEQPQTEQPPTRLSPVVRVLVGCGCILGLVVWAVLL